MNIDLLLGNPTSFLFKEYLTKLEEIRSGIEIELTEFYGDRSLYWILSKELRKINIGLDHSGTERFLELDVLSLYNDFIDNKNSSFYFFLNYLEKVKVESNNFYIEATIVDLFKIKLPENCRKLKVQLSQENEKVRSSALSKYEFDFQKQKRIFNLLVSLKYDERRNVNTNQNKKIIRSLSFFNASLTEEQLINSNEKEFNFLLNSLVDPYFKTIEAKILFFDKLLEFEESSLLIERIYQFDTYLSEKIK